MTFEHEAPTMLVSEGLVQDPLQGLLEDAHSVVLARDLGSFQALPNSTEAGKGRPSSPHTALAGAVCALHSEFFTSEPLKSGLCCPRSTIVGAQKSLQFRRRQALGSQDSSSEFRGVLGAARSALSGSEQFGVLGRF